ncbi:hypothetical protein EB22_02670 [Enterococcus faecium]|nr:hypothetical protein EB22_02670 [Enterococcus faecium]
MAYEIVPSKHVIKYLKKLKEKPLKEKFLNLIYDEIAIDPYKGEQKTGGLSGIWSSGFKYAGTTYRVAYEIIENKVIPVLLCGTHENFYEQLKKLALCQMMLVKRNLRIIGDQVDQFLLIFFS